MNQLRTHASASRGFRSDSAARASGPPRAARAAALGALVLLAAAVVPGATQASTRHSRSASASRARTRIHRVRQGETASVIAARYRIPLRALLAANKIRDRDKVDAGRRLVIPSQRQVKALLRKPARAAAESPKPGAPVAVVKKRAPTAPLGKKPAAAAKAPVSDPAEAPCEPATAAVPVRKAAAPTVERVAVVPAVLRRREGRVVGESLPLTPGRARLLPVRGAKRVQIDDATGLVADVQPLSTREILILGKAPGTTILRVWDERGIVEHEIRVISPTSEIGPEVQQAIGNTNVTVRMAREAVILDGRVASAAEVARAEQIASAFSAKVINLLQAPAAPAPTAALAPTAEPEAPGIADQVRNALRDTGIEVEGVAGKPDAVVLRGTVARAEDAERMAQVASALTPTVVNLIEVGRPEQVRVQVRMVDVDRRVLKELGIRWSDQATWGQTVPDGEFRMLTTITAEINALIETNRANTLAAPSLLVSSGEKGQIAIGGRLPIPALFTGFTGTGTGSVSPGTPGGGVPAVGSGLLGQSVQFVDFGVKLELAPIVMDAKEIALKVSAEVSSIDRSTAVNVNGSIVPGFTQRRTETAFRMRDGNTLVIGGLISKDDARAVHKFPILADIPVLGRFFQSVRREKSERELIIFVTPQLVPKDINEPDQTASPTPGTGTPEKG